jgi:MarR family transcriptional regulator, organic hydroperoxide resistance regulator
VSGPTAVKMAQRMEAKGLVERRRDEPDGRLVRVYLTDRGRKVQGPVAKDVERVAAAATAGLTRAEREAAKQVLEKMRGNLRSLDA